MSEPIKHPTLYTRDSEGRVRVWWVERDGDKIRNIAGIEGGSLVESKWKEIKPKNIGKRNAKSAEDQAIVETEALYKKQLKKHGYWEDRNDIDNGPRYIEPMLAEKLADYPITDPTESWYSQPKYDGFRCMVQPEKDLATSKHGDPFATVGHIVERLNEFPQRDEIMAFDGELYNHELREDFNQIASLISKKKPTMDQLNEAFDMIQYYVYDFVPVPEYAHLTYEDRYAILQYIIPADDSRIKLTRSDKIEGATIEEFLANVEDRRVECLELEFEGQMLRRGDSLYEVGRRVRTLIKNKVFIDEEFVVIDILEGKGNGAGLAKKAEFKNAAGETFRAGINGNNAFTRDLLENKNLYIGGEATVRYFSLTPGKNVPRFGKVTQFFGGPRRF